MLGTEASAALEDGATTAALARAYTLTGGGAELGRPSAGGAGDREGARGADAGVSLLVTPTLRARLSSARRDARSGDGICSGEIGVAVNEGKTRGSDGRGIALELWSSGSTSEFAAGAGSDLPSGALAWSAGDTASTSGGEGRNRPTGGAWCPRAPPFAFPRRPPTLRSWGAREGGCRCPGSAAATGGGDWLISAAAGFLRGNGEW